MPRLPAPEQRSRRRPGAGAAGPRLERSRRRRGCSARRAAAPPVAPGPISARIAIVRPPRCRRLRSWRWHRALSRAPTAKAIAPARPQDGVLTRFLSAQTDRHAGRRRV